MHRRSFEQLHCRPCVQTPNYGSSVSNRQQYQGLLASSMFVVDVLSKHHHQPSYPHHGQILLFFASWLMATSNLVGSNRGLVQSALLLQPQDLYHAVEQACRCRHLRGETAGRRTYYDGKKTCTALVRYIVFQQILSPSMGTATRTTTEHCWNIVVLSTGSLCESVQTTQGWLRCLYVCCTRVLQ